MQQKTDVNRILWLFFWAFLGTFMICTFPNCSKDHNPHEPPEQAPPDTVVIVIIDTLVVHEHHDHPDTVAVHEHHDHPVGVTCDTVDVTIEFTLIKDQSAPNVYAIFFNGVEVERIVISETSPTPVEVMFVRTFDRFVIGRDSISIQKIKGSRAETIGSRIVKMECSQ